METHALARIHVRACTNFLVSLFPTPFLFPCTSYKQSSVVSNGNSKSEQHHRQQHQKRSTVRFEAVFLLLCWLPLSSFLYSSIFFLRLSSFHTLSSYRTEILRRSARYRIIFFPHSLPNDFKIIFSFSFFSFYLIFFFFNLFSNIFLKGLSSNNFCFYNYIFFSNYNFCEIVPSNNLIFFFVFFLISHFFFYFNIFSYLLFINFYF